MKLSGVIVRYLPPVIVAVVVAALFSQTRHYGLMGFDSYPIIATSRIESLADLIGTFTEKLMDGRYAGDFYRPLLNLSFAVDHMLWGLNAFGYQLTNVLLLGAWAGALHALLRRLLGPRARVGPLVGVLVFMLSALQFEVLPVPARRADLLCGLFMVVALWLQLAPRALKSPKPQLWPAVATLAALGSKETAFALPVLIVAVVALYSERKTLRDRLRHAAIAVVPHLAAVGLITVARFAILGGIGGHRSLSLLEIGSGMPRALSIIVQGLVWPQPLMRSNLGTWLLVVLALGLLATAIWVSGLARERWSTRALGGAVLGVAWVLLLSATYSAAGQIGPWYFLLPLAGWALLSGSLVEVLVSYARIKDRVLRVVAVATLAFLSAQLVWQARFSPLFRHYDEWERATSVSDAFLNESESLILEAAPGSVVHASPLPNWVLTSSERPAIRGAAILADYSVQAWADLTLADRNVRVISSQTDPQVEPGPDEIQLRITRRLKGY